MQRPQPRSDSPIKKQLARKLVSYFDQLDEARSQERAIERSRSRSKSISKLASSTTPLNQEAPNSYVDIEARRQKLADLKELMRRELLAAKMVGATKPNSEAIEQAIQGYPSFMKAPRIREHYKVQPVLDSDVKAFKQSVHKLLEQKVKKEDLPEQEESSIDTMDLQLEVEYDAVNCSHGHSHRKAGDVFDEHLYPLDTSKKVVPVNTADSQLYDFHQRKSKEIRRIQYASECQRKSSGVSRTASKEKLEQIKADHKEHIEVVQTTYAGKAREKRTHPDEGYPVWVRFVEGGRRVVIPALLKNVEGFKVNPQTDTMEVIEKDRVTVNPRDGAPSHQLFQIITGRVERPNKNKFADEDDCEIVVQDKEGKRTAILFFEREAKEEEMLAPPEPEQKGRVMEEANCRAFDVLGKFLGRGRLWLQEHEKKTGNKMRYAKGILINSDEKIEFVLAKFFEKQRATLKRKNLSHTSHRIEEEEDMEIAGYNVKCLTLSDLNRQGNPELLFILDGEYVPQKDGLLTQEEASCELEDFRLFEGELKYEEAPGDREGTLWLLLTKAKEAKDARTKATRKSTVGFEKIRIELDDLDPNQDIINILDRIKLILESRKRAAENARLERERLERERLEKVRLERERLEREERERLERERLEREERERLERERLERENAAKTVELRKLKQSEITTTQDNRSSVIHGGRRSQHPDARREGAREATEGMIDFIVICPGGNRLHIFVAPNGKAAELEEQIEVYYDEAEDERAPHEPMSLIYNGYEYTPANERRPKQPLRSDIEQPWEIRVIQPFDEERQRELEQRERERLARQQEDEERLRRIREEEERLAVLRWQDEERARRAKEEETERQRLLKIEEAARLQRIRDEEERLRRIREEEEAERQRRIREEEERIRLLQEEMERNLLKIREESDQKERARMQAAEAERLRRIEEEEERLRQMREDEERIRRAQEEEDRVRRLRESEDRRRKQEEEERRRKALEEEERERNRRREEEERLRVLLEEQEREYQRRLREDEERRRIEEEAEMERRKQLETQLRERLEREAEAERQLRERERLRLEEEAERWRQEQEEELRRRREEEERLRRLRESEDRRRRLEEDEKRRQEELEKQRQLEEIENTQRKVRELKEALERSRVENSQEITVIKKSTEIVTNNRYRESVESDAGSKKQEVKQIEEQKQAKKQEQQKKSSPAKDPRQRFSVIQPRVMPAIDVAKKKAVAKKEETKVIKYEKQAEKPVEKVEQQVEKISEKSSSKKSSHSVHTSTVKEERSQIKSIRIQETNEVTYREGERLTKIELNIENSEDDIDFIGYGQLRYSNKKDQSRSPSQIKESFTRVSPAREIVMTKERNLTTRPFTPNTSEKKSTVTREVVTSTLHNGQVVAHHTESQVLSMHDGVPAQDYSTREEQVGSCDLGCRLYPANDALRRLPPQTEHEPRVPRGVVPAILRAGALLQVPVLRALAAHAALQRADLQRLHRDHDGL